MKLALAMLSLLALPAYAESLPWNHFIRDVVPAATRLLATVHVNTQARKISVSLPHCGDTIKAVNLKISGGDVSVSAFGLVFVDNQNKEMSIRRSFAAGSESGWIDLSMLRQIDSRCVKQVYAMGSSSTAATVRIYGEMK